jgi:hypothetical protein
MTLYRNVVACKASGVLIISHDLPTWSSVTLATGFGVVINGIHMKAAGNDRKMELI